MSRDRYRHTMTTASVQASWVDGAAFRKLWEPLADADEFLLTSCYVSQQGWEELETLLVAHLRRAAFRATLVFSLAGISEKSARFVIDRLYGLVIDKRWKGRVAAYVIDDRTASLFHPKAHGSRCGTRTKLVVGSGNLTGGGMGGNLELMSVIEDDPVSYQQFRTAIEQLAKTHVVCVDVGSIAALRDGIAAVEAAAKARSEHKQSTSKSGLGTGVSLPTSDYGILLPPNADYLDALRNVGRLATQGGQLARLDQLEPLSIAVPLTAFRDAGLLAVSEAQEFGAGLSYETGGGSIAVSLLPNLLRKRLVMLTRPLGRLVGRFSIEMLGFRWMPNDWEPRLQEAWQEVLHGAELGAAESEIKKHVEVLHRQLRSGKLKEQLSSQLEVRRPAAWKEAATRRLLGWNEERTWPSKLTEGLRREVVSKVLDHVQETVGRRLTPEFPIMQLKQVGRGPLLRSLPLETIDIVSSLHFLAEWSIAGVIPRLRSASGDLTRAPGRSGVVEVIARRFDAKKFSPDLVFDTALQWQTLAIEGATPAMVQGLLASAWADFVRWFGLTPETATWAADVPSWTVKAVDLDV